MKRPRYGIIWDNGHANGMLNETFGDKRVAARHATRWKREMVSLEPRESRAEARQYYQWDVVSIDENGRLIKRECMAGTPWAKETT